MARVSATFLSAALVGLTQEMPRDGVVLTVAHAPDPTAEGVDVERPRRGEVGDAPGGSLLVEEAEDA